MDNKPTEVSSQNELSFFLGLLQEEAAEVIQIVSKNKRFGLTEHYPKDLYNNKQRMEHEMKDLITIARILEQKFNFDFGITLPDISYEESKRYQVDKYKNYSESLGLVK